MDDCNEMGEFECAFCDFVGEAIQHENPEHLWGPAGEISLQCPQCDAFEDCF